MSSPSIGVTKVVCTRWMMSWVILSPSCSASRISRGVALLVGPLLEHLLEQAGGAQRVLAGLVEEVEEDPVAWAPATGAAQGQATNPRGQRRCAAPPCPSHFSGGCGGFGGGAEQARDLADACRVEPEQGVRPGPHGDRALGVVAQGEARHAQERRLLLDAAGVRQDRAPRRPRARGSRDSRPARPGGGPSPAASPIILRVRGWTGNTTGHLGRHARPAPPWPRPAAGVSTSAGRWSVTSR